MRLHDVIINFTNKIGSYIFESNRDTKIPIRENPFNELLCARSESTDCEVGSHVNDDIVLVN